MPSISRGVKFHILLALAYVFAACAGNNTASIVGVPGKKVVSPQAPLMETGGVLPQGKSPIDALNMYLDGFHFYNGQIQSQVEAHHFCSIINEEVNQCVIFDGNTQDAKIIGVEYIISKRLFQMLPPEEKKLWHSHVHEVKSGQLVAPGIPQQAEHEFMQKLIGTYGKTWHTWHTDQSLVLPLGHPLLMMGFTADGQAQAGLVASRDRRLQIQSKDKRKDRKGIVAPPIAPGADAWQQGHVLQLTLKSLKQDAVVSHPDDPTKRAPVPTPR